MSPTRRAQGNAVKTIFAMAFALSGERGETIIESQSVAHRIVLTVDPVRQTPQIEHTTDVSLVKIGTRIRVCWPNSAT